MMDANEQAEIQELARQNMLLAKEMGVVDRPGELNCQSSYRAQKAGEKSRVRFDIRKRQAPAKNPSSRKDEGAIVAKEAKKNREKTQERFDMPQQSRVENQPNSNDENSSDANWLPKLKEARDKCIVSALMAVCKLFSTEIFLLLTLPILNILLQEEDVSIYTYIPLWKAFGCQVDDAREGQPQEHWLYHAAKSTFQWLFSLPVPDQDRDLVTPELAMCVASTLIRALCVVVVVCFVISEIPYVVGSTCWAATAMDIICILVFSQVINLDFTQEFVGEFIKLRAVVAMVVTGAFVWYIYLRSYGHEKPCQGGRNSPRSLLPRQLVCL